MDWNKVSFITGSEIRFKIFLELKSGPKTPTQVSKKIKAPLSHVSKGLSELEKEKIVICLTPTMRKNKFYSLTELGKDLLKDINEITKKE